MLFMILNVERVYGFTIASREIREIRKLANSLPPFLVKRGTKPLLFIYTFAGFSLLSVSSNSMSVHRWMGTIRTSLFSNCSSHLHTQEKEKNRPDKYQGDWTVFASIESSSIHRGNYYVNSNCRNTFLPSFFN